MYANGSVGKLILQIYSSIDNATCVGTRYELFGNVTIVDRAYVACVDDTTRRHTVDLGSVQLMTA